MGPLLLMEGELAPIQAPRHFCPPDQRKYVLIVAILASAMGFIDSSVVAIALPQMRTALGADFSQAQWIANSYMLMLSALVLLGGSLGDRFGTRTIFGWGVGLFVIASFACTVAQTSEGLIVYRAFQGAGAALMIPGSMALISINTPRAERGGAMGIWIAASSITTALGPLLGGYLLTYGGSEAWRWIFAINIPVGALVLFLLWRKVPVDAPRQSGDIASLDWTGAGLVTLALGLLAAGLTYLGEMDGGHLAYALFGAGIATATIAIWWERKTDDPMIQMSLFSSKVFSGANMLTFLTWTSIGTVVFFTPMLLIVAWNLPPSYAGGMFWPFSVSITLMSPIVGKLTDRLGPRFMLTLGSFVVGLSNLMLGWAIIEQSYWYGILPAMLMMGLGIGLSASPLSAAIMNSVDDDHAGAASGINNMVARGSGLFAIAGLGSFVTYAYTLVLRGSDLNGDVIAQMVEAGFGERLTGGLYQVATTDVQAVAMNHAMIALCLLLAILSFTSALVGFLTQEKPSMLPAI